MVLSTRSTIVTAPAVTAGHRRPLGTANASVDSAHLATVARMPAGIASAITQSGFLP